MQQTKQPINQPTEVAIAPIAASEVSELINQSATVEDFQAESPAINEATDPAACSESDAGQQAEAGESNLADNSERSAGSEASNPPTEAVDEVSEPDPATDPRVVALCNEAEQRGYLRGRNEKIEELMAQPGLFQPLTPASSSGSSSGPSEVLILNNMRPSIWDL